MRWIVRLLVNAVAIFIAAHVVHGITLQGLWPAIIAALVLGALNLLVRPVLVLFTLPINVLTFGLFTFIINAILFYVAGQLVSGFRVDGAVPALFGSIVVSIVSTVLHWIV